MNNTTSDLISSSSSYTPVSPPPDVTWTLCSAGAIFFMQAGFMFLEAGGVNKKNIRNSMFKSYVQIGLSAIFFYLIGYAIGFGANDGIFAGSTMFAGYQIDHNRWWCFQYAFCVTYTAIVSSSMAERARTEIYFILIPMVSSVTYPVVVSWIWGEGWLYGMGYVDFAGSSVVHLAGGISALACVLCVGNRSDKFPSK